jgi:hypothetical protein
MQKRVWLYSATVYFWLQAPYLSAQQIDDEYNKKIKEYTTDPALLAGLGS